MILSDTDIRRALKRGEIKIDPEPEPAQYSTSSLDLRLGDGPPVLWDPKLFGPKGVSVTVDLSTVRYQELAAKYTTRLSPELDGGYLIKPGMFVHTLTFETVALPRESRLAARVEGRSSLARLGLTVHITAPTIQCGWEGAITLEMFNLGPFSLKLVPRMRICQLIVERVSSRPGGGLQSSFQKQKDPTGNR